METTIEILVKNEQGELLFKGTAFDVDGAIQELGRYERHFEDLKPYPKEDGYTKVEKGVWIK